MLVPSKPSLNYKMIFYKRATNINNWSTNTHYFNSGSDALTYSFASLKVPPGSKIVLPALICRSVTNVLTKLGHKLYFVDSAKDSIFPDSNVLVQTCTSIGANVLYLVDLFGFLPQQRQSIISSVQEIGCTVIEDRCHSALTQPNVECADAVIYSLRKTLPTRDGGAVRFLSPHEPTFIEKPVLHFTDVSFLIYHLLENFICNIGLPNIYGGKYNLNRKIKISLSSDSDLNSYNEKIVSNTKYYPSYILYPQLINNEYLSAVAKKRINNYIDLSKTVTELGMSLCFDVLPHGVVPQVMPVIDPSETLVDFLRKNGIGASRWPDYEAPDFVKEHPELFPNANRFNRQIVCLPVHQSINAKHIKLTKNCILKWASIM